MVLSCKLMYRLCTNDENKIHQLKFFLLDGVCERNYFHFWSRKVKIREITSLLMAYLSEKRQILAIRLSPLSRLPQYLEQTDLIFFFFLNLYMAPDTKLCSSFFDTLFGIPVWLGTISDRIFRSRAWTCTSCLEKKNKQNTPGQSVHSRCSAVLQPLLCRLSLAEWDILLSFLFTCNLSYCQALIFIVLGLFFFLIIW